MTCNDLKFGKLALKALLPFIVAFAIGVGLSQLINSLTPHTSRGCWGRTRQLIPKSVHRVSEFVQTQTHFTILRVPEVDFSEGIKRSRELHASLKLRAVFDSDGQVRDVSPVPLLPWGVSEAEAGTGKYQDATGTVLNEKFIKGL